MGLLGVLAIVGSLTLIPMFENMFLEQGIELPLITKVVFFVANQIVSIVLAIVLLVMGVKFGRRVLPVFDKIIKHFLDRMYLKLPIIKNTVKLTNMYYFSSSVAVMLGTGIRLTDGLELAR